MTKKILIAASGTGGHVIPALNIAEKLLDTNYKITWIGTKKGIENKLVNNDLKDAVIEFAYQGPLLKLKNGEINFAITGNIKFTFF